MAAENIDDVVDGLAGIVREAGRAGDRIGYFAALYRQVTVELRTAIHGGLFDDGARMDRFDTHFGNRYFEAYEAWRRARSGPRCWRAAFGLLGDADTIIVQHLVLGVNAHINLDLAIAAAWTSPGAAIRDLQRDFLGLSLRTSMPVVWSNQPSRRPTQRRKTTRDVRGPGWRQLQG